MARGGEAGVEVYLAEEPSAAFMPDRYVYPGGRVDHDDASLAGRLLPKDLPRAASLGTIMTEERAAALVVAGLRECFEEAGVLFAEPVASDNALRAWRTRLVEKTGSFAAMVETLDLRLQSAALVCFDHWITPTFEARRYDTRFFVARMPARQVAIADDVEVYDGRWWRPSSALEAYARRDPARAADPLHAPGLAPFGTVDALMAWAAGFVVPILPTLEEIDSVRQLLPGDPRYPRRCLRRPAPLRNIDGVWERTPWPSARAAPRLGGGRALRRRRRRGDRRRGSRSLR